MIANKIKIKLGKQLIKLLPTKTPITNMGENSLYDTYEYLCMHRLSKPIIITDKIIEDLFLTNGLYEYFSKNNLNYVIYNQVKPDPTFDLVEEIISIIKKNNCDSIIAIGGGSVIDSAKVASLCVTNNVKPHEKSGIIFFKNKGLPFICAPTTAGTGSEATTVAVISDPSTHAKQAMLSEKFVPDLAILDPCLTTKLPLTFTAFTTLDALTHAVESYVSGYATEETKYYSLAAIKLIYDNFEKVLQSPENTKHRQALLVASFYAGHSFTRAFVGYVHAFAHQIGGQYGVAHGHANAVLLPHVLDFYLDQCETQFAEIYDYLELGDHTSKSEKAKSFVNSVHELLNVSGISPRLEKLPTTGVESIVKDGFKECHGFYPVPKYMTFNEAVEIVKNISN